MMRSDLDATPAIRENVTSVSSCDYFVSEPPKMLEQPIPDAQRLDDAALPAFFRPRDGERWEVC